MIYSNIIFQYVTHFLTRTRVALPQEGGMTQYDADQTAQSVAEDVAGDSGMSGTEASLEISDFLGRCTYIYICMYDIYIYIYVWYIYIYYVQIYVYYNIMQYYIYIYL